MYICVGISESLTKLRVIHEALSASLSAATDGAYQVQVQDLVQSTEEGMQHLSGVAETTLDYQSGLFGHLLQSMVIDQAAAVEVTVLTSWTARRTPGSARRQVQRPSLPA